MSRALGFVNTPQGIVRYDIFVAALFKQDTKEMMLNHAALGVAGEAGEVADLIKKEVHYGKPTFLEDILEELGDVRFYLQAVMNLYGVSEQAILDYNAEKLMKRYPSGLFSKEDAIARKDKEEGEVK